MLAVTFGVATCSLPSSGAAKHLEQCRHLRSRRIRCFSGSDIRTAIVPVVTTGDDNFIILWKEYCYSHGACEETEGQRGPQRKEVVHQDLNARLPLRQCGCARVPMRVPCPLRLPCWAGPSCRQAAPRPSPPLPCASCACLFLSPAGGGSDRGGGRRRREIVLITPWFQQETTVRHARLPPSPQRQETQGRMPKPRETSAWRRRGRVGETLT